MGSKPRILFLDIENAPNTAYVWGLWQETTSSEMVDKEWYVLTWAAKWLGEKKIISSALVDFPKEYKKNPENDKLILLKLRDLINQADIVCAHNGINFDMRKINARFIMNGIPPANPVRVIDTLLVARKYFFFTSNKLTDLGKYLNCGSKIETNFKLWKGCMSGDKNSWSKMVKYCKNDITLLEKIYLKLRPYMSQHPHMNIESERPCCPKCGSNDIQFRGYSITSTGKFRRFQCKVDGGWGAMRVNELPKEVRKSITKNI